MNPPMRSGHFGQTVSTALLVWLMAMAGMAFAAPGAHGPNGEHLDSAATAGGTSPEAARFEAQSETFELVGLLQEGELSILINRYETNEPVLDAKVEVETGDIRASAKFHADLGDYAVDDPALLQALTKEGSHPLLITIVAGQDSDLLDGTLRVRAPDPGHPHEQAPWLGRSWSGVLAAGLAVAVAVAVVLFLRRRTGRRGSPKGEGA